MIKILFILLLSSTCVLLNAATLQYGLKATTGEPLELLELRTKALVEGPYAEVLYIQTYKNPLDYAVETNFLFPRTYNSIFHKFEAIFRNQTLVGKVLEKQTAQRMYDWNVRRGNSVAYSARNQAAPDIMTIKVGNIPANETVEIVFSVIQPLRTIINKFYELKLPVVLTERYAPASVEGNKIPSIQTVDTKASLYKEWNIEVQVKSNTPFAVLANPTHNLKPELSEQPSGSSSKIYKAIWNATLIPNKDFVVYFGPEKLEKPETILATYPQEPNNHVLLVNFIPDLNTIETKVAQRFLEMSPDGLRRLRRMAFKYDIENAQAEFIFVIDRSGSMEGARIANLRKALAKFLNTIPKTSYFNIISFGSSYQLYSPQSVLNSPQALDEALQWVQTIQADMGGTEILQALKALSDKEHQGSDLPKIVMILTDGDVFNPDEVINHISNNANKMRFCSVGIGYGASDYLVRNMAKAGKCRSEFVLDNEDIGDKALYLVQAAISQYITDIQFDINCFNHENQNVYTEKAELDLLLKDQAFSKWIYLENTPILKFCQATLAYYNSLIATTVTEEMEIQRYELEVNTDFWHKIAYDAKIRELEQTFRRGRTWKVEDIKSQIIELSTKYQVLSDYTSFLAVLQESTVNPNEQAPKKINIPSMKSADYSTSQPEGEKPVKVEEKSQEVEVDKFMKIEERSQEVEAEKPQEAEKEKDTQDKEDKEEDEGEDEEEEYTSNCAGLDIDIEINANVNANINVDINADHMCSSCETLILNVNTNIEVQNLLAVNADEFCEDCDNVNLGLEIDDNVNLDVDLYYDTDMDYTVDMDDSYWMMDRDDDIEPQIIADTEVKDSNVDSAKSQEEKEEEESLEGEDESSKANYKDQNLEAILKDWNFENFDSFIMKECSGEKDKINGQEKDTKPESIHYKSPADKTNYTINANLTESLSQRNDSSIQLAENFTKSLQTSVSVKSLISDKKESENSLQSTSSTSKGPESDSNLKVAVVSVIIILLLFYFRNKH